MKTIQTAIAEANTSGALVLIAEGEPSELGVIGTGASQTDVADYVLLNASGSPCPSERSIVAWVHGDQVGLPAEVFSCASVFSNAEKRRLSAATIAESRRQLGELSEHMKAMQLEAEKTLALLVSDIRINVNQQRLIDRGVSLSRTTGNGVQELSARLDEVSASVKLQSETTRAAMEAVGKQLTNLEAQLRRF